MEKSKDKKQGKKDRKDGKDKKTDKNKEKGLSIQNVEIEEHEEKPLGMNHISFSFNKYLKIAISVYISEMRYYVLYLHFSDYCPHL